MAISKFAGTEIFIGQSAILLFDEVADYTTAKLSDLTGKNIGDVKLGSTSWTGDDIENEDVKNEQGAIIAATAVLGTYAFECSVPSVDEERLTLLLKSVAVADAALIAGTWCDAAGGDIAGFGTQLSIIERPIAIVNDTNDKILMFPKAKIISSPMLEDKVFGIKLSVTAQSIDTDNLKTAMLINGAVQYA